MIEVSNKQFEELVANAIDSLDKQMSAANNVGIVIADDPTPLQRKELELRGNETLFGLYEGIPLTKRNNNYSGVVPDKITLFKGPLTMSVNTIPELQEQIRHTLWHELAHHFGLDHAMIHERE
jgi:predicted Zn-dependent protease with MMP-like domain